MSGTATERIIVMASAQEKKDIVAKARGLGVPIAELMRRGAFAYQSDEGQETLMELADAAKLAAERACKSIDETKRYVDESNKRIAAMEQKALKAREKKAA
jgi:hypothetical protein